MATNLSDASALAWILAIEALASFSEVDTSLLIDLAPGQISDHVGENAREKVSLRILESLSAQKKGVTGSVSPKSDSEVGFDQSESCENVLREILHKTSGSSLIDSAMLKRDFEPFIQHKRSCLPKSALQQLKDAILEDNHLIPTSLKERSGLLITNQSDGNTQRSEGSDSDVQEISSARNSLSAKRVRNDSATDNHGGPSTCNQVSVDNAYDVRSDAAKDPFCTQQAMKGQNSVSFHGSRLIEDFSGRIVQHTENGSASSKEPQVGALKENNMPENVNYEYVASKRLRMSNDVDGADLLHNQQQASRNDEKLSQDTSGEEQGQNMGLNESKEDSEDCAELKTLSSAQQAVTQEKNSVDEAKEKCEHSFPLNAPNDLCCGEAKAAMDHSCEPEISRENDGFNDENNDIIGKNSFLSSQCTCSEDSLGTAEGTEQQHCIICKKGGQLLVCRSDACPRVVHESCLGVAATFDESGSFYCPFCAYSQAISEFMNSKKKCSLARKYLASFTGSGVEYLQRNNSKKLYREDQNRSREDEDLDECIEPSSAENVVDRVNNTQSRVNTKDLQQAEPSVSSDSPCGVKGRAVTNGGNDVPTEDKSNAQKTGSPVLAVQNCEADDSICRGSERLAGIEEQQEVLPQPNAVTHVKNHVLAQDKREAQLMGNSVCCQSSREQEPKIALQAVQDCEVHNSNCSDSKIVHGSEQHGGIEKVQEVLNQQNAVLPQEIVKPPSSSGEKKDKSIASNHTLRVQKQEIQYTYPAIPLSRRRAIPWTNVEEETLKEGVRKFASKHDTKMPWKTILEFGSAVFHKGRTAIDIKDKWRNICKGTPKA